MAAFQFTFTAPKKLASMQYRHLFIEVNNKSTVTILLVLQQYAEK